MNSESRQTSVPKTLIRRDARFKSVAKEAREVWAQHAAGKISSEEAQRRLHEMATRYENVFDRLLAM
jgi:hypothetical protein